MALLARHKVPASRSLPVGRVNCKVFGPANNLKIARGIVERVAVYVVDMLIGGKLASQEPLHYKSVLGLVMPVTNSHIPISVLDVLSGEDPGSCRRPVPSHQGVVVLAQPPRNGGPLALGDRTGRVKVPIRLPLTKRVAVLVPPVVVHPAESATDTGAATNNSAIDNLTKVFLSWHGPSIAWRT